MKKVAVIMGSDSDLPVVGKAIDKLGDFGVPVEVHVMSAHRTPEAAAAFQLRRRTRASASSSRRRARRPIWRACWRPTRCCRSSAFR